MTKVTLTPVANLIDTTTAETTINNNSNVIVAAFDNTLSRDGTSPNQMSANLDMNSYRILNLPTPTQGTDPVRLEDIDNNFSLVTADILQAKTDAQTAATTATTEAGIATTQAGIATTQAGLATTAYTNFNNQYLGSKSSDPTLNNTGGALVTGNLYWNSTISSLKFYNGTSWVIYSPTLPVNKPLYRYAVPAAFTAKAFPCRQDIFPFSGTGSSGLGSVQMTCTPSDVWRRMCDQVGANQNTCYVDPVNGSDANTGTQASPYKTLSYALNTAPHTNVVGIPTGPFQAPSWNGSSTVSFFKRLNFLGPAVIGNPTGTGYPDVSTLTWTNTSGGVWQTTIPGLTGSQAIHRFVFKDTFGQDGNMVRVPHYASQSALQTASNGSPSTINGWYFDAPTSILYVAFANNSMNTYKTKFKAYYYQPNGDNSFLVQAGANLFIDVTHSLTFDGTSLFGINISTSIPSILIEGRGLVKIFAAPGNGIHGTGGFYYFSGVDVEAPLYDCFNFDPGGGFESFIVIHNCRGNYAGDVPTYATDGSLVDNRNGSSFHGGANGIVAGCSFNANYGPTIADVGTDGYTSLSWHVGVENMRNLTSGDQSFFFAGSSGTGLRNAWLDTCTTSEEQFGSLFTQQGTAKYTNCSFDNTLTTGVGGSNVAYVRNAP